MIALYKEMTNYKLLMLKRDFYLQFIENFEVIIDSIVYFPLTVKILNYRN